MKSRWTSPAACAAARPRPAATNALEDLARRAARDAHHVRERLAVDELHRDEHAIADGADVVDRDDVRVGELRDRLRLAAAAAAVAVVRAMPGREAP